MRLALITVILASVALIAAPAVLADGDPASDVLVENQLFNPVDSGISLGSQARLESLLNASAKAGFRLKVALIASQTDLGTATAFWRSPGKYAQYLGYELSELYGGQLLVVMPSGFGLYGPRSGPHTVGRTEHNVQAIAPGSGEQLATAALSAVPLLARAAGHPIPAAELAAAGRSAIGGEGNSGAGALPGTALLALVVGAVLIALAWTLSLRARPLGVQGSAER